MDSRLAYNILQDGGDSGRLLLALISLVILVPRAAIFIAKRISSCLSRDTKSGRTASTGIVLKKKITLKISDRLIALISPLVLIMFLYQLTVIAIDGWLIESHRYWTLQDVLLRDDFLERLGGKAPRDVHRLTVAGFQFRVECTWSTTGLPVGLEPTCIPARVGDKLLIDFAASREQPIEPFHIWVVSPDAPTFGPRAPAA